MVKQTLFVTLNSVVAFALSFGLFYGVFRTSKDPIIRSIYEGGPLVVLLMAIFVLLMVFVIEPYFSHLICLHSSLSSYSTLPTKLTRVLNLLTVKDSSPDIAIEPPPTD